MTRASGVPDVGDPRLVHEVHPDAVAALGTLWVAVTRAGGAVGFLPDSSEQEIRAAARAEIEAVRAGRQQLIVLGPEDALAGAVVVRRGAGPRVAHRGEVLRLMVRPDLQGRGRGSALLGAAVAHATALGLEQLLLSARGGTDLPAFYAKQGWTEVGVWPKALRLGPRPEDLRDEHWFQLLLGCGTRCPPRPGAHGGPPGLPGPGQST